jgi:hypothetical protein
MNILVIGCSLSDDSGFIEPNGKVWHHYIPKLHNVTNLSISGHSNYKIFIKTCAEILANSSYDLVVVQWSSLFRLSLNKGLTIYDNHVHLTLNGPTLGFDKFYDLWEKNFIHPRVTLTEFLSLVSALAAFLKLHNINYVFIKGSENFLNNLIFDSWRQCSDEFLDIVMFRTHLPDWEIDQYYTPMRKLYVAMTNLTVGRWVNLDHQDWFSNIIDVADDGAHAGILTNKMYYNQFNNFIKTIGINL